MKITRQQTAPNHRPVAEPEGRAHRYTDFPFVDNRSETISLRKLVNAIGHKDVTQQQISKQGSAIASTVVQRTTLQIVFAGLKDDASKLADFSNWITTRAGEKQDDWVYLLSRLTLEEVNASIALYQERVGAEQTRNSISIEDIINNPDLLPPSPPDREIDQLLLSSPQIGELIVGKQSVGVTVAGQVIALDDADFAERHWQEWLFANRHIPLTPDQKNTFKLREMARVDRVDGFQSVLDGKIYLRPTRMGIRIAIHEAVHKYSGAAFEALLGHLMNEGATDYIAMQVCAQIGAEIAPDYYPLEKKLLIAVMDALKILDSQLFSAYFNDALAPISNALVGKIGSAHAVIFRKAANYAEAVKAFNDGQREVASH
jgi:hypothetical protein